MTRAEDFLTEAKSLLAVGSVTEITYRTATNRAYYAAHHALMAWAVVDGFRRDRGLSSHRSLIEYLAKSSDPEIAFAGQLLQGLFQRRLESDYNLELRVTRTGAQSACDDAAEIIEYHLVAARSPSVGPSP